MAAARRHISPTRKWAMLASAVGQRGDSPQFIPVLGRLAIQATGYRWLGEGGTVVCKMTYGP